jgi:hypothetical protein
MLQMPVHVLLLGAAEQQGRIRVLFPSQFTP